MIDEYRFSEERAKLWRGRLSVWRAVAAITAAIGMFVLQALAVYFAARGGK